MKGKLCFDSSNFVYKFIFSLETMAMCSVCSEIQMLHEWKTNTRFQSNLDLKDITDTFCEIEFLFLINHLLMTACGRD